MAEEFKIIKPIVLSKEMDKDFEEIRKNVSEGFAEHREREINELLKVYGLTLETIVKSNYIISIGRKDGVDEIVLGEVVSRRPLTNIESFIDQVIPKDFNNGKI